MGEDSELERRRRRLIYRSCYTGMKETDLLLGAFAKAFLPGMTEAQLDRYEALLETQSDPEIYAWATGKSEVPPEHDTDVMKLLKNFKIAT
ncbi:MAG: succinate dehydrogenase assembly factor 2 [Alphaproteobacteria bacterium]|nr:succinate dehydrogenase assembly factor 2 [Alphaproteobacteria bacterium]